MSGCPARRTRTAGACPACGPASPGGPEAALPVALHPESPSAGHVTFRRRRFYDADRREEGSFRVFDMRVGLEEYERFVPEARETCAKLARRVRTTGGPDLRASIAPSYCKSSEI